MIRRCKICHSASSLDETGRCSSCADAKRAEEMGLHYGEYMARKEIGALPEMPRRKRFEAAILDYEAIPSLPKCRVCGKDCIPPKKVYCSRSCEAEGNRRKTRKYDEFTPRPCLICGKPVIGDRRRKYCSPECYEERKRQWDVGYKAKRKEIEKWRTQKRKRGGIVMTNGEAS